MYARTMFAKMGIPLRNLADKPIHLAKREGERRVEKRKIARLAHVENTKGNIASSFVAKCVFTSKQIYFRAFIKLELVQKYQKCSKI